MTAPAGTSCIWTQYLAKEPGNLRKTFQFPSLTTERRGFSSEVMTILITDQFSFNSLLTLCYSVIGGCIRCRQRFSPFILFVGGGELAVSFNYCERCLTMTGDCVSVRGNVERIWRNNIEMPKIMMYDIKIAASSLEKENELYKRTLEARLSYLAQQKVRRDIVRAEPCSRQAETFGIKGGLYKSWGYGPNFDEYFGGLNNQNLPHGEGVKFYSDGSVYAGGWERGVQKTDGKGIFVRSSGTIYEGTWMSGKRHGIGRQTYKDGSEYTGQFANGFEHGEGVKTYADKSVFEGRFRFGRRDGPGTLTTLDGTVEKGLFRDKVVDPEKPPPMVYDADIVDESRAIYHAPSLLSICIDFVAKRMLKEPKKLPPSVLQRRLPDHLKPKVSASYLKLVPLVSQQFRDTVSTFCFRDLESIKIDNMKIQLEEIEMLIYLTECNSALKSLAFYANKFPGNVIETLGRTLESSQWKNLTTFEIHFNNIDLRGALVLMNGVSSIKTVTKVKLVGCRMVPACGSVIAGALMTDDHIEELDLAFNMLGPVGAQEIAQALMVNKTLKIFSIRMNDIQTTGGMAIVEALLYNKTLKQVCLVDNNVGDDVMGVLSARQNGTMTDLVRAVRGDETQLPQYYEPSRYSWKNH